jgi:hypothetical protein
MVGDDVAPTMRNAIAVRVRGVLALSFLRA